MADDLEETRTKEDRPGLFDDGDHTEEKGNARLKGELTDPNESDQLFSEVGERVQEMAGNDDPRSRDVREQEQAALPNDNLVADRFDQEPPRGNENIASPQTAQSSESAPDIAGGANDNQPLVPDDAFQETPLPLRGVPVTGAAPAPQNETSPYQGQDSELPFGEDDKVRNWTTGVGEQQGGYAGGNTTVGGETDSLTE